MDLGTAFDGVLALGVICGGGVWIYERVHRKGSRDKQLDELLANQLAIERKVTPNGGSSDELGDIAIRTEKAVRELRDLFMQHVGNPEAHHR